MIVGIVDGILKKFNEKFPRQAVKNFDKITAVNGKSGSANDMRRPAAEHEKLVHASAVSSCFSVQRYGSPYFRPLQC